MKKPEIDELRSALTDWDQARIDGRPSYATHYENRLADMLLARAPALIAIAEAALLAERKLRFAADRNSGMPPGACRINADDLRLALNRLETDQ